MDDPGLDAGQHRRALRGLERINVWSVSAPAMWPPLRALAGEQPERPVRVLDLATGAGDVPIALWRLARRAGVSLTIAGCDRSPVAVAHAREQADQRQADVRFFEWDVLASGIPPGYDALTCSLFLHHLSAEETARLLRAMVQALPRLVIISDLVRSRTGLALAYLGTHLLSTSSVVHFDGPQSVRGAYTMDEVRTLAGEAGMVQASIVPRWPCRYLLRWQTT